MPTDTPLIKSAFWKEIPEADNPFAAQKLLCSGYDVYGDLLPHAQMIDMLWLLFNGEAATKAQRQLLNGLSICLANLGPRDPASQAAMSAAAGGSGAAACLMSGLAVAAGNIGGARELLHAVRLFHQASQDLQHWQSALQTPQQTDHADTWLPLEHPPGFDINGVSCTTPVRQALTHLHQLSSGPHLLWLREHRTQLESWAKLPLSMVGVAAAAMADLGLHEEQAEMLFLLLRLPGLAAHALEQRLQGWDQFPFYADGLDIKDAVYE